MTDKVPDNVEIIPPSRALKKKVGDGGLSETILEKAQTMLENTSVDFTPVAEIQLATLMDGLQNARAIAGKESDDHQDIIDSMIYPAMQLKGSGGMFKYQMVSDISVKLLRFLESINYIDDKVIEIVGGFHTAIRAVVIGQIKDSGGPYGDSLVAELDQACRRYYQTLAKQGIDISNMKV